MDVEGFGRFVIILIIICVGIALVGTVIERILKQSKAKDRVLLGDKITCPKCQSTQITSNKKGFGCGLAALGFLLFGGVGLLFGLIGSLPGALFGLLLGFIGSGQVKITCLQCGNTWEP